jgi:hypothetical protein
MLVVKLVLCAVPPFEEGLEDEPEVEQNQLFVGIVPFLDNINPYLTHLLHSSTSDSPYQIPTSHSPTTAPSSRHYDYRILLLFRLPQFSLPLVAEFGFPVTHSPWGNHWGFTMIQTGLPMYRMAYGCPVYIHQDTNLPPKPRDLRPMRGWLSMGYHSTGLRMQRVMRGMMEICYRDELLPSN